MWHKQSIQQLVVNRSNMIAHEVGPVKDFYYKDVYLEKVRFFNFTCFVGEIKSFAGSNCQKKVLVHLALIQLH